MTMMLVRPHAGVPVLLLLDLLLPSSASAYPTLGFHLRRCQSSRGWSVVATSREARPITSQEIRTSFFSLLMQLEGALMKVRQSENIVSLMLETLLSK